MMFTKKHYEAIAFVLNDARQAKAKPSGVVRRLADLFQDDNPHFNRRRFVEACGIIEDLTEQSKRN